MNNRRFSVSLALAAIAHILIYALFVIDQEHHLPSPGEPRDKRIAITLSTLPSPKSEVNAGVSKPEPPVLPVQPEKPAAKDKPRQPPLAHSASKPRAPRLNRPQAPKRVEKEPLPVFKDDFPELAHDYRRDYAADSSPGTQAAHSDTGDGGVHPGAILNINPKIIYPRHAVQQRLEGVVVVLIHIGTDGHTNGVDLLRSSGHQELDDQVLGAVQHWRFTPPMRGNTPVEGSYRHTVVFGADEKVDDFDQHWREVRVMPDRR